MDFGLVNYIWRDEYDDDGKTVVDGHWDFPGNCRGSIGLASMGQILASKPGQPRGVAFVAYDEWPKDADGVHLFGEDLREARPDAGALDAFESWTGIRPQGDTGVALLRDFFTRCADPAQEAGTWLMAPDRRRLKLFLSNECIVNEPFVWGQDPDYTNKLQTQLTRQLAEIRARAISGECRSARGDVDYQSHQKFADWLCEKYAGKDLRLKEEFLAVVKPAQWDEPLVPHETQILDNFNSANNTDLNAGGRSGAPTWTEVSPDATINTNQVRSVNVGDNVACRAETDLSGSDMYAACDVSNTAVTSATRWTGPAVRFDPSANSHYTALQNGGASSQGIFRAHVCTAGTYSPLGSGTAGVTQLALKRIEISSTNIYIYSAGVLIESTSDGTILGNTRTGFVLRVANGSSGINVDNFDAGDLAVAGQPFRKRWGGINHNSYTPPGVW